MNLNAATEKFFAGRWIAGYYLQDAIDRSKIFNSKGISTLINFLGEDLDKRDEIAETMSVYTNLIKEIKNQKLKSSISIKPTQIGLSISYKLMLSNYLKISKTAKDTGVFVWLDMEGPNSVDDTISAYKRAVHYGNTGICIQSYLKRSVADVNRLLLEKKARIRLVKGAYKIKSDAAFKSHREVSHNYMHITRTLLEESNDFMIATHDSRIIEETIRLNRKYKKRITFAMLNGIRNKYAKYLAKHGQKIAVYVPFGKDWVSFGYRRLMEQRHLSLILRSLLEGQEL